MDSSVLRKLIAVVVGLTIAIPVVLLMFITPAAKGAPHDVPVGVVGPPSAVAQIRDALDRRSPGGFDVRTHPDADALRQATRDREVYGGFVLAPRPQTVIATGGGPAVAALLTQIGEGMAARAGGPDGSAAPQVVDVASPRDGDPRGAGFGAMVMPVFMAGIALGLGATVFGRRRRILAAVLPVGAAAVSAAAIGAATAAGVLGGHFALEWIALAAGILAIGTVAAGVFRLVGPRGIGLVVLLFLLIGMPLAGIAAPPEFLPSGWATLGQSLPLGATGSALRGAAFFDGAGTGTALAVLAAWIVVGAALLAVPKRAPDVTGSDGAGSDAAGSDGAEIDAASGAVPPDASRARAADPAVGDPVRVS